LTESAVTTGDPIRISTSLRPEASLRNEATRWRHSSRSATKRRVGSSLGLLTAGLGAMATGFPTSGHARGAPAGAPSGAQASGVPIAIGSAPAAPPPGGSATAAAFGPPVRLSRERLDAWACEFFPAFNQGGLLPAFSAARHVARRDVELRTLTTFTRIPETGERVAVTGLLAVPAGATGRIPLVSW